MAGVDPETALRLAKATADLYGEAVSHLLGVVAGRLARGIDQEGWAERKLLEVTELRLQVETEIAGLIASDTVPTAVRRGYEAGAKQGITDLSEIGVRSTFTTTNTRAVQALVDETVTAVTSIHRRILRSTMDAYRDVIASASGQVVTGADTRRHAAQRALDRFANQGITGFVDDAGRNWSLESYTEMATRTAAGRAQVAGSLDRYVDAGRDLVIVSDSPRECSVCRPWEGQVLSISGAPGHPSVDEARSAGLLHANCTHNLGLYVPGLTRPMGRTADPEGDRAKQEQRRLERGVRQWKRREAVAITPDAERLAQRKAKEWRARLGEHVQANDLKRQRAREALGAR